MYILIKLVLLITEYYYYYFFFFAVECAGYIRNRDNIYILQSSNFDFTIFRIRLGVAVQTGTGFLFV